MLRTRPLIGSLMLALALACSNGNGTTGTTGGNSVTLSYTPCSGGGYIPTVLIAVRDGTGPWQTLTPSGGTYSTIVDSAKIQLLTVASEVGETDVAVIYALPSEARNYFGYGCRRPLYTANGTVNNLAANDEATFNAGWSGTAVNGPGTKQFTVSTTATTTDILGVLLPSPNTISKLILRRAVAYNALSAFDFTSAEAFAVATPGLTVTGNGSDAVTFAEWFQTANGFREDLVYNSASTTLPTSYWAVPSNKLVAGDLHELYLYTSTTTGSVTTTRVEDGYFHDPVARTMTFSAVPTAPIISQASSIPYARLRAQYQLPAGHNAVELYYYPNSGNSDLTANLTVTAGYLGSNNVDITFPDLSTVTGFNTSWMLPAGVAATWSVSDVAISSGGVFSQPTDGKVYQTTAWRATIGP